MSTNGQITWFCVLNINVKVYTTDSQLLYRESQLINDMLEGLLNEDKDLEMKLTLKREICLVKRF